MSNSLPSPWKEFPQENDSPLIQAVGLHRIGGFAVVNAYGLPRSTNDLDYFTPVPSKSIADIQELGGEGTPLAPAVTRQQMGHTPIA